MAGGSGGDAKKGVGVLAAAMEPRPDGRGKRRHPTKEPHDIRRPQWSPGRMAGGRNWKSR